MKSPLVPRHPNCPTGGPRSRRTVPRPSDGRTVRQDALPALRHHLLHDAGRAAQEQQPPAPSPKPPAGPASCLLHRRPKPRGAAAAAAAQVNSRLGFLWFSLRRKEVEGRAKAQCQLPVAAIFFSWINFCSRRALSFHRDLSAYSSSEETETESESPPARPAPPSRSTSAPEADVRPSPRKPRQYKGLSASNGLVKADPDSPLDSPPGWDTTDGRKLGLGASAAPVVTIPQSEAAEDVDEGSWDASDTE